MSKTSTTTCVNCDARNVEVCADGYCPSCHVSLSFEDCRTGTFAAAVQLRLGKTAAEVRKNYPNADIERARTLRYD